MARPLSEEARQKALTAAAAVIAEHGIEGFTVDAVAKASGVAKTTIYRHWDSGNALLLAAIDCMIVPFPTPNTGSLATDLRSFLEVILPVASDNSMGRAMLGLMAAAASDEELAKLHQAMMRERMTPIVTMLELAVARGEIRPDVDLDLALDFIEGPFFFRKLVKREPLDSDQIDQLVSMIVAGLTDPNLR